jgi:hypothetical protein
MYDAGAGDCFDVLAAQGYGFFSGPTDRRLRPFTLNFGRPQYLRDTMVANGDADKALWITEAAWNPVDSPEVPPNVSGRENFGVATREQAAAWMPLAYQRAQQEWPWMGVISYWFFKRPADYERDQSWYYFRMVEPDFTPLPVYDAMRDYLTTLEPTLYRGVHQADHWAITRDERAALEAADGAQLGEAERLSSARFTTDGTRVTLRWQGAAPLTITLDEGSATTVMPQADGWTETVLTSSLLNQRHTVEIYSATPFLLDSVTVTAITTDDVLAAVGIALAAAALSGLIVLGWALWRTR